MDDAHDALALADPIRSGALSARDAMMAALARADAAAQLGAIRLLDRARGLRRADALDALLRGDPARAAAMPFFGVPFLMKDLGAVAAGFPVIAGSRLLLDTPPPTADSDLAARFRGLSQTPGVDGSLVTPADFAASVRRFA